MKRGDVTRCRGTQVHLAANQDLEGFHTLVPEELCRSHLDKVTASATFARAQQLRRLVEWLGCRSLEPEAVPPTEKEIGETVLRRKDFDPQTDSLVRKEMSRLREKLNMYYAKEGARDRVQIRSAGGYLFRFAWSEAPVAETAGDGETPCLLVLPFRSAPDLDQPGSRLVEELLVRVGERGGAEFVSPTTALSYEGRVGDIRAFAAECGADFVVEGSLDLRDTELRATVWFVDGRSGRTERPGRFAGSSLEAVAGEAASWLLERIARSG